MEYSALVLLNPIRVRVMKMIEYISELEALIASSSEVNWVDVLAKYNIYSLEISQLESFLAQKNIRSFLASMLIEPRILPQERPDERWFGKIRPHISSSKCSIAVSSHSTTRR